MCGTSGSLPIDGLDAAPPVVLAPLAGITDLPFRRLVASFGIGWVVSEMVASQEMVQAKPGVRERAALGLDRSDTAVQIAGREARWMAEAARMVEASGARLIDINMGCPAKKVTNGWSGAALLRDPDHAIRLIEVVVGAVGVPVTLKTRLGWDDGSLNAAHVARRAVEAGVRLVTIHGRTRCQFYQGRADWDAIRSVVEAVDVPVVANGDVASLEDAREALHRSGARGVMVGRAAQGAPWLPAQIAAGLAGRPVPAAPTGRALSDIVTRHYEAMLSFYGGTLGARVARKHLGWYMDRAGTGDAMRRAVLTSEPAEVLRRLPDALGHADRARAA